MASTDQGVAPYVVQGSVVTPTAADVIPAGDVRAHDFFNVLRDLIYKGGYHSEADLEKALAAVSGYEKQVLGGALSRVVSETDRAAREDVTQRVPPQVGVAPVAGPGIDYNALAAAIVALQRQEAAIRAESAPAE